MTKKNINLDEYWPTFRPKTIVIPQEGEEPATVAGTMVHLEGVGDVMFIHKSLVEGDDSYVIAHGTGLTFGMPVAENFRQAKKFARVMLGSTPFCADIKPTQEEMLKTWFGSDGAEEVYLFYRAVTREQVRVETEAREAAWAEAKPTLEEFLEQIAENTEEMEVWLHPEFEDEIVEWVAEMSDEDKQKVLSAVFEACRDYRGTDLTYISDWSNGQLGDPDKDMLLGDWWLRPEGKLQESKFCKLIEACGADYAFGDTHAICDECRKAVETSPTHYGWQHSYHLFEDGDILCSECIEEDPSEYLDAVKNNPRTAITSNMIDPEDFGYTEVWGEFANGLYGGQMDSPDAIAKAFEARGWNEYVFALTTVGQFDVKFKVYVLTHQDSGEVDEDGDIVWVPVEDVEYQFIVEDRDERASWRTYPKENRDGSVKVFKTHEDAEQEGSVYVWPNFKHGESHADIDPAEAMRAGLRAAAKQTAAVQAEVNATGGVAYSQIHGDGTATTRVVSPEEFIAGIQH